MLRLFIACGARLDQRPGNGWAAILIAAKAGNSEVIRILSGAGCVLDSAKGDDLAMAWISAQAKVDVRRALATVDFVNRTPDSEAACIREVTSQSGHQGMMSMAHRGDITSLRAVMAAGADVEELLPEVQLTPVFGAAMSGNMETLVFLVEECGANVGHIAAHGSVVLTMAAATGNLDVFFYLVGKMPPALLDYADDHGTHVSLCALLQLLLYYYYYYSSYYYHYLTHPASQVRRHSTQRPVAGKPRSSSTSLGWAATSPTATRTS